MKIRVPCFYLALTIIQIPFAVVSFYQIVNGIYANTIATSLVLYCVLIFGIGWCASLFVTSLLDGK